MEFFEFLSAAWHRPGGALVSSATKRTLPGIARPNRMVIVCLEGLARGAGTGWPHTVTIRLAFSPQNREARRAGLELGGERVRAEVRGEALAVDVE
jgi:hypothetical protein